MLTRLRMLLLRSSLESFGNKSQLPFVYLLNLLPDMAYSDCDAKAFCHPARRYRAASVPVWGGRGCGDDLLGWRA